MRELAMKTDACSVGLTAGFIEINEMTDEIASVVGIDNDTPFLYARFPADALDPGFAFGCQLSVLVIFRRTCAPKIFDLQVRTHTIDVVNVEIRFFSVVDLPRDAMAETYLAQKRNLPVSNVVDVASYRTNGRSPVWLLNAKLAANRVKRKVFVQHI